MPTFANNDDDQTIWEKMLKGNSSGGTYEANLPPDLNLLLSGNQGPPQANPQFDPATLLQGAKSQSPAPVPPGGGKGPQLPADSGAIQVQGGALLPMNPFLSQMQSKSSQSSQRKNTAEQMIYDLMKQSETNPAMDAQKASIQEYSDKLKEFAAKPIGGFASLNLAPIAALADAWNPGSKLAQNYQAPETPEDRKLKLLALQNQLTTAQGGLSKEQNDLLKDKLGALVGIDKSNKDTGMTNSFIARADETNHRQVLQNVKNNPDLRQRLTQSTNLANALSNIQQAKEKPPQSLSELQNVVRSNIGIKGTTGLDEREKNYFNNAGIDASRLEQYLFNSVKDIGESQADVIAHLEDLVKIEQTNIERQAHQIIDNEASGQEAMYQRRPDLYQGLLNTIATKKALYNPKNLVPESSGGSHVSQSKYRSMTPEQVKAEYDKKFGKGKPNDS